MQEYRMFFFLKKEVDEGWKKVDEGLFLEFLQGINFDVFYFFS